MKKTLISIIAITALFIAGVAMARDVDRTLDADADAHVSISNIAGEVQVTAWKERRVQVTGTIGDDVEELVVERDGNEIRIKVRVPDRSWGKLKVTSHLKIRVPEASSLEISTVSADISVDGVRGDQELQSVSGKIRTEAFAADIEAESVSGNVYVKGNGKDGAWRLSSVSGSVRGEDISGDVEAEVVSGRIDIHRGSFDSVDLETVNGRIEFTGGLRRAGRMDVESVNGSVDIEFTGEVSARFDIETFNGGINNCFGPKAQRTSRHTPGWDLSFTEGRGEGRVAIETLNGSVTVCKK